MMDPRKWVRNVCRTASNSGSVVVRKLGEMECLSVSGIVNTITPNHDLTFRRVYPSIY